MHVTYIDENVLIFIGSNNKESKLRLTSPLWKLKEETWCRREAKEENIKLRVETYMCIACTCFV
jgi:hypothetical protein